MRITFLAEKDDTITVTEARASPEWSEWVVKVVAHERYGSFGAVFSLHAGAPPNVTCLTIEPGGQQLVVVKVSEGALPPLTCSNCGKQLTDCANFGCGEVRCTFDEVCANDGACTKQPGDIMAGDCERCREPETEWVSECCGVGPVEGTDLSELSIFAPSGYRQGFCGGCHDHAEFEEREV